MASQGTPTEHTLVDGRFELTERFDDRGFGGAWEARDTRGKGRKVMVKFLRSIGAETTRLQGELAQHLKALSALRHASVLTVVHHGLWEGRPFLVHDAFEGTSLVAGIEKVRATGQPLAPQAIENLFDRVCAGVEVAHGARPPLVHGLLDGSGVLLHRVPGKLFEVRVMDFGLTKYVDLPRRTGLVAELSVQCRAPECNGLPGATVVADVYALGVLLRELLGAAERGDVPAAVHDVVARATLRDPAQRVASVKALRDALRSAWSSPARVAQGRESAPVARAEPAMPVVPAMAAVTPAAAAMAATPRTVATPSNAAVAPTSNVSAAPVARAVSVHAADDVPDETEDVEDFARGGRAVEAGVFTLFRQSPLIPTVSAVPPPASASSVPPTAFAADEVDDRTLEVANMPPGSNPWDIHGVDDAKPVVVGYSRVSCWGRNDDGQLGDGTTTNRLTPIDVRL